MAGVNGRAYYNEIDKYAAQWLRNLISAKLIADGDVDERSIVDVRASDLNGYTQCHFFAGLGGWSGALRLANFPNDRPVWTGSCPCQPFSLAGKQKGFADDRHLWPVWRELIAERRPAKVYGEQVASAAKWLGLVRSDLEALDYAVGTIPCEAASAGAYHLRDRFWFVADSEGFDGWCGPEHLESGGIGLAEPCDPSHMGDASRSRLEIGSLAEVERGDLRGKGPPFAPSSDRSDGALSDPASKQVGRSGHSDVADCDSERQPRRTEQYSQSIESGQQASRGHDIVRRDMEWVIGADGKARRVKPGIRLLAHGVPARVAKLRALGNAIDLRAATAFIKATM